MGFESLDRCPLGRLDDLVEASGATLSDDALDADEVSGLVEVNGVNTAYCLQQLDDSSDGSDGLAGIAFFGSSDPARNFSGWFEELATSDDEDDPEFEGEQTFASGTIHSGCTNVKCHAWWNDEDDDVAFGLQINSDEANAGDVVALLKKVLPTLTANLAEDAPDTSATGG